MKIELKTDRWRWYFATPLWFDYIPVSLFGIGLCLLALWLWKILT